jgi:hypothetical protein
MPEAEAVVFLLAGPAVDQGAAEVVGQVLLLVFLETPESQILEVALVAQELPGQAQMGGLVLWSLPTQTVLQTFRQLVLH